MRFKHVNDPEDIKEYANIRKVSSKTLKSIINCGYIELDDIENQRAIYHCPNILHNDDHELAIIWDRDICQSNLSRLTANKRRAFIKRTFLGYKVYNVNKSINEPDTFFMCSELRPVLNYPNSQIEIVSIRSFKSCKENLDFYETKIKFL